MWPYLQVSNCSNKLELTLGYVEARNGAVYKHFQGQTFNIRPRMTTMNSWCLVCYKTSSNCSKCHLELFCKNDFSVECINSWMSISVRAITNISMTIWISIGDRYLFQQWTKIRVSVTDQIRRRHLGTSVKDFSETTYLELDIENLLPNSWYFVEVCTQIDPPEQFLELYNLEKSLNNCS